MEHRITCQVLSLETGEYREVIANVKADSAQVAVDKLFALAKDERAYRFLSENGVTEPSTADKLGIPNPYADNLTYWAKNN
jgi:hypothetical protein